MTAVRLHPDADRELADARDWYAARSEVAAQAFALDIDHAISRILEAPLAFPIGGRGERRYVLQRFPYTILYRVTEDHVFITAIAHQSRRPEYWRHRK